MRRKLLTAVSAAAIVSLAVAAVSLAGGRSSTQSATITLKDFKIVQPKLAAGQTTLTIKNTGKFDHNYQIVYRSGGASKVATKDIKPGASATVKVDLKPGAYVVLCSVFNGAHVAQGMVKGFSVGKIDFNTGKWGS